MDNIKTEEYLLKYAFGNSITRHQLLDELDRVWDMYGLSNTKSLKKQQEKIANFYSHPVWIINGLFSEIDTDSKNHRISIANYTKKYNLKKIADFGGGSGILAKYLSECNPDSNIDVIEPYPLEIFTQKLADKNNIKFMSKLEGEYDLIIAQDVLEHVENPISVAQEMISSVKIGGYLYFANCFFPEIKCHLPSNFYLRNTFKYLMILSGLKYIGLVDGTNHVQVFQKISRVPFLKSKMINNILYANRFFFDIFFKIKSLIKKCINKP